MVFSTYNHCYLLQGCVKIANLAKIAFPPNSFDIILARETIEYMDCIEDIFERFKVALDF